jgi:hypothetical protein
MPSYIIRFIQIYFSERTFFLLEIPDFRIPSEKKFFPEFILVFSGYYFYMFLWQILGPIEHKYLDEKHREKIQIFKYDI